MIDAYGRTIDHLRLSLTAHCNLACRYCVPVDAPPPRQRIDSGFAYELVRWLACSHGIRHVRLTGGEPLLYPALLPLVERLAKLDALHEITLTTNGQALARQAARLRSAGLSRVNVSLDTLDPERFAYITRGGNLAHTLRGVEAAVDAGLTPVKINVIAQRGLNDDELPDLAAWGLSRGCVVRFLEVMPIGPLAHVANEHLVPAREILARLRERFELRPIHQSPGNPSRDYAALGGDLRGTIGVIAATTRPFCSVCRRLRITSTGELVACLLDRRRYDLAKWWDGQRLEEAGADLTLREAVMAKPPVGPRVQPLNMVTLGG